MWHRFNHWLTLRSLPLLVRDALKKMGIARISETRSLSYRIYSVYRNQANLEKNGIEAADVEAVLKKLKSQTS